MSIFSKIGDVLGGVWDKIADVIPFIQSFIRVPMSEQNAADFARAGSELERLGNALVAQGRLMQEVVLAESSGGDAITLEEGQALVEKAKVVGQEAEDAVQALKEIAQGIDL